MVHTRRIRQPAYILLVDDDEDGLTDTATILERAGYVVTRCGDRKTALQTLRVNPRTFDVVLTDMHLGRSDPNGGLELAKDTNRFREQRGYGVKPLVLCITAFYKTPEAELLAEHEGARYVSKGRPEEYLRKVGVLLLELERLERSGPVFRIVHLRAPEPSPACFPDEEVSAVELKYRTKRFPLALPLKPRLIFDYLARYVTRAQTARQIADGMTLGNAFYFRHFGGEDLSTRAVITNVSRIRGALDQVFRAAGISQDPRAVLVTEGGDGEGDGPEEKYRLKATIVLDHQT